jgi:SAM-dependent methyltransferase
MGALLNVGAGEPWSHAPKPWINIDCRLSTTPDVVADIMDLPFADGTASRVYLGHVLEHLALDRMADALAELMRVLKPGGKILAVGPDVDKAARLHRLGQITDERLASDRAHDDGTGNPCLHQWDCTGPAVVKLLQAAGFWRVREVPITQAPVDFPVFDRGTLDQLAVVARK